MFSIHSVAPLKIHDHDRVLNGESHRHKKPLCLLNSIPVSYGMTVWYSLTFNNNIVDTTPTLYERESTQKHQNKSEASKAIFPTSSSSTYFIVSTSSCRPISRPQQHSPPPYQTDPTNPNNNPHGATCSKESAPLSKSKLRIPLPSTTWQMIPLWTPVVSAR